jgi:hypothetical protein
LFVAVLVGARGGALRGLEIEFTNLETSVRRRRRRRRNVGKTGKNY